MVAWQLGPSSANQDQMQQEFSPWHIKERARVLLQFNWFCFGVIHIKGRADAGPFRGAMESAELSCVNGGRLRRIFPEPALSQAFLQPSWTNLRETAPLCPKRQGREKAANPTPALLTRWMWDTHMSSPALHQWCDAQQQRRSKAEGKTSLQY